jgi:large conductance mechanosensitive channel
MGFISEFKDFALKGNVFDLAIGVIIGGAFGKLTGSLIDNVLNPIIGKVVGNVDFSNWYIPLSSEVKTGLALVDAKKQGAVIALGSFVGDIINFIILAYVVFLKVKAFNSAKKRFEAEKPAPAPAGPTMDQKLLTEIRDLLARR